MFDQEDIIIVGDGFFGPLTLVYDIPTAPNENWQGYSVWLMEGERWKVGSLDGREATHVDFIDVLGNITALYIRGEFRGTTDDHGGLDNVYLTRPAVVGPDTPEPSTLILFTLAAVGISSRRFLAAAGRRP